MRKFVLLCLLAIVGSRLQAQDIIHVIDSSPIEAEVIEIGDRDIVYKEIHDRPGRIRRIPVSEVTFIDFEDGQRQVFNRVVPGRAGLYSRDWGADAYLDYRHGRYYHLGRRMSADEIADYIGLSLYGGEYRNARNRFLWGTTLISAGVAGAFASTAGLLATIEQNNFSDDPFFSDSSTTGFYIGYALSAVCLGTGIPLFVSGNKRLNAIADDYNESYGRRRRGISLSVGSTSSGVGLAMRF